MPWAAHSAAIWLVLNAVVIELAIRRVSQSRYGSERRSSVRFTTRLAGEVNGRPCRIEDLSLTGARVVMQGIHAISDPATLRIRSDDSEITLTAHPRLVRAEPGSR